MAGTGKHIQGWLHVKANTTNGDLDPTFTITNTGLNGPVTILGLQSDGKIIIGGEFTAFNDLTPRNHIARLNTNGSLDTLYDPLDGVFIASDTPQLVDLKVQSDNQALIGGYFNRYNGTPRNNIARVNTTGSLDTSFDPGTGVGKTGGGASVNALAIQPSDGKVLVGGDFDSYNGTPKNFLARLSSTGALEAAFPTASPDGIVYAIAIQAGGKILIGGSFTHVGTTARSGIARLNNDGTLDTDFHPVGIGPTGQSVNSIALQEDKIYIAGNFSTYNGASRNGIARLNSDGSLDTTFDPGTGIGGTTPYLLTVVPQPDGRILIGGSFSTFNGSGTLNFARLNNNGSMDWTFLSRMSNDGIVNAILLQPDGKIVIGGAFSGYLTRLLNKIDPCYTLTALVNPTTPLPGGTVSVNPPPNCPGGKYISGTSVQLIAARNAANDYWFTHWSGEASGSSNPVSVIMDADKIVTANFMASPGSFQKLLPANGASGISAGVNLSWTASAGASSYEYVLYTDCSSDCPPDLAWISTGGNTTVSLTNLCPSATYYWQVRARNQVDTTDASDGWWTFTRNGFAGIPVPLSPAGAIFATQPSFRWNVSNGADFTTW